MIDETEDWRESRIGHGLMVGHKLIGMDHTHLLTVVGVTFGKTAGIITRSFGLMLLSDGGYLNHTLRHSESGKNMRHNSIGRKWEL